MSAPVRPFVLDPEVLAGIRTLGAEHVPEVARLHAAGMGEGLWGRLGEGFLRAVHGALVGHPGFLGFVYVEDGRVRGFIAGAEDPPALLRASLRRVPALFREASRGLLRDPSVLLPLLETAGYFRRSGGGGGVVAESLFCAVEPDLRGRGAAGHLNKVLFDELAGRGHARVKVTTEVANEAANRQLLSWGFVLAAEFRFYGKAMRRYELDLAASPRVRPVRRHGSLPGDR